MASASLHEKRGVWQAVWYDPTRRPRRIWRTLRTRDAGTARARLVQLEREHARGDYDPWRDTRPFDRITITDAARRYLADQDFRPSTVRNRRSLLNRFDAHMGGGSVTAVTARDVEAFMVGCKASTANTRRAGLVAFFAYLVEHGHLKENPATDARLRKAAQPEREALRPHEIDRIIANGAIAHPKQEWMPAVITLLVSTGLRVGELAALRVEDCQSDRIVVGRSFQTKTGKGRVVPLFPRARAALGALIRAEAGPVVPALYSSIQLGFKAWAADAYPGRPLSVHYLRHTWISWMANDLGLPVPVVAKMAGHTDIKTTMRYVHVTTDTVMDAIDRAHGAAQARPANPVAAWLSTHGLQETVYDG